MSRITIDISKEELDFIREALAAKYRNLISYLDDCESSSKVQTVLQDAHDKLKSEIETWTMHQQEDKIIATQAKKRGRPRKDPSAPFGRKKDGTPKKAPGRPRIAK